MPRIIFSILLVLLLLSFGAIESRSDDSNTSSGPIDYSQSTNGQLYEQAKFYYNQLLTNQSLQKSRESWLKGTRNFRRLFLLNPKDELAPSCLFMLGRMYRQMYENFKLGLDLDEALGNFNELIRLFPGHRLEDDAHLAIGLIYLNQKQDPQKAANAFETIVTRFPEGDMRSLAADKLKLLSKEYDIALPKILIGDAQSEELNTIFPAKHWSSQDYSRIVVMAAAPITYNETIVDQKDKQRRLFYIDFKNSYIEPQFRTKTSIKTGLLKQIRTSQFSADTVRFEIDVESIDSYKIFSLPEPFRVVIDIRGKKDITPILTKKSQLPTPKLDIPPPPVPLVKSTRQIEKQKPVTVVSLVREKQKRVFSQESTVPKKSLSSKKPISPQAISLAQQLGLGVKKIVLDPGHGGKDPGAMANNMQEKDIVLKIAKELKPVLQKELGCEVVLTRQSDVFLPLEERTAIANTQEADLFISLHINAHPSTTVRGTETYFLNFSTNADAMRVAAMENATSTHQMSDLEDILSDIMKTSKIDESSRLAQNVHNAILSGIDQKIFGKVKNLGVKQAPFYVLIGADMPAILLEIAFLSNEDDARNLRDPKFVASLTKEITSGIRSYMQINTASLDIKK